MGYEHSTRINKIKHINLLATAFYLKSNQNIGCTLLHCSSIFQRIHMHGISKTYKCNHVEYIFHPQAIEIPLR